jgi:hypothetical protein
LNFESKTPRSTARRPKAKERSRSHLEEGKAAKPINGKRSDKSKENEKDKKSSNSQTQKLPLNQTPPNTLNATSAP